MAAPAPLNLIENRQSQRMAAPNRPTCKVVLRENERGARIAPKGCKVRTTYAATANRYTKPAGVGGYRKYNKFGFQKEKHRETGNSPAMQVAGPRGGVAPMIFDTGAQITLLNDTSARTMGIFDVHGDVGVHGGPVGGVGDAQVPTRLFNNVDLYVGGRHINTSVYVTPRPGTRLPNGRIQPPDQNNAVSNLLGADAIRQMRRSGYTMHYTY